MGLKVVEIIYFGNAKNKTSDLAKVVFPSLSVFEKDGSFVNQNFRLQKFNKAIPGPFGIVSEVKVLTSVLNHLGGSVEGSAALEELWNQISNEIDLFRGIEWSKIPGQGIQIDGSKFDSLEFFETENLKFKPKLQENAV
mgnify:FL=1